MTQDNSSINLQPGEMYFSQQSKQETVKKLKTILGSCVAVTIWHSKSKIAGMCHFLLAQEAENTKATQVMQRYRYGEEALDYLLKKMVLLFPLDEFEVSIFGGSNMYPSITSPTIGEINVKFAQTWAKRNNIAFNKQDTLGNNGRSVTLDLNTGKVSLITYTKNIGAFGEY